MVSLILYLINFLNKPKQKWKKKTLNFVIFMGISKVHNRTLKVRGISLNIFGFNDLDRNLNAPTAYGWNSVVEDVDWGVVLDEYGETVD